LGDENKSSSSSSSTQAEAKSKEEIYFFATQSGTRLINKNSMPKESVIRKKAIAILTELKWVSWYAPKVKFHETDIFGVFDLICWEKSSKNLKFIQLTTLSNLSARRKKIKGFLKTNKITARSAGVEIWAWNSRQKNFKIELV
jgi:hypothetical protein